jgi:hypothetical protein
VQKPVQKEVQEEKKWRKTWKTWENGAKHSEWIVGLKVFFHPDNQYLFSLF